MELKTSSSSKYTSFTCDTILHRAFTLPWEERTQLAGQNQTSSHFWFTVKGTIQNDIIVPIQDKTSIASAPSEAFSTTHILFVGVPQFADMAVNDILTVSLNIEGE